MLGTFFDPGTVAVFDLNLGPDTLVWLTFGPFRFTFF